MEKNKLKFNPSLLNNRILRLLIALFFVVSIIMAIVAFTQSIFTGLLMTVLIVAIAVVVIVLWQSFNQAAEEYIKALSVRVKQGQQEALIKIPFGIILFSENQRINWVNPFVINQMSSNEILGKKIDEVHPELAEKIGDFDEDQTFQLEWSNRIFDVYYQADLRALYLMDMTKYAKIEYKYEANQTVIGFIQFDNYDEVTNGLRDLEISRFNSFLTTYFSNWFRQHNIFYKKIDDDKYLILTKTKDLENLKETKFNILDSIRDRTSKRNMPLTISIGISYGEDADYNEIADTAQANVDLALGRGGDQAVIREVGGDPIYYGGKSNPMEKRTRVRSRMVSQTLDKLMLESDNVFVMGHQKPDMDSIGASLGVRRIAEINGSNCYVVIDEDDLNYDVDRMVAYAKEVPSIAEKIISPEEAEELVTDQSLVVLVDHHKPSMSIAPGLLEESDRVAIIDHHRRGDEFPEEPLLVYIEPYASSASELITEMFEYVSGDGDAINKVEATALLGGIVIDTNNFSQRTGSRTFNAASFLQSVGANNNIIKKLQKEDVDDYLARSEIIEHMSVYFDHIAIATGKEDTVYSNITAAQTADTLLTFTDIEASFVIFNRDDGRVGISARSIGKINVQRIMEEMGGGGHLTNAATQVEDMTVPEVKEKLIEVISEQVKDN